MMRFFRHIAVLVLALAAGTALAAERSVAPGKPVQPVLDAAAEGAAIRLEPGVHAGPLTLDSAVTLEGADGTVVEGTGKGNVITVTSPAVVARGLTVRGSGTMLSEEELRHVRRAIGPWRSDRGQPARGQPLRHLSDGPA